MATIKARIGGIRSGTAALWTGANPVLLAGEPAFETDTKKFTIGDGVTAYNSLPKFKIDSVFQAAATILTSLSALGTAANKGIYVSAPNTLAEFDLSPFARTFLDDADAAAVRTTLGITTLLDARAPATQKHTIWLPAGSFIPTVTNGATYASQEMPTNDVMISSFDFDAATDKKVQAVIAMPKSWDEGTITAQVFWKDATTAGAGDVVWGVRAAAVGNDDALDAAFGVAQTVADTFIAAGDLHASPVTAAITASGPAAENDLLVVEVYRDADAGGDTYTQSARFLGVKLIYTTNAADDA